MGQRKKERIYASEVLVGAAYVMMVDHLTKRTKVGVSICWDNNLFG